MTIIQQHSSMLLQLMPLLAFLSTTTHAAIGDLLWSDEFDVPGLPNARNWNYDLGGGGWGNWEYQDYTNSPDNANVEADGALKIRALRTSESTWTSARLNTAERLYVKYGTIEARIQIPDLRNGLWAAFWTLGQNFVTEQVPWPDCGELDVLEMGWSRAIASGVPNQRVLSAIHYGTDLTPGDRHGRQTGYATSPDPLNTTFHTYRLEWTPTIVRVTVDGVYETLSVSLEQCGDDCRELHQPHSLLLNLAVGGGFTQLESDYNDARRITATFPATMAVDYVRIYDNGFTELSGPAVETDGAALPPPPLPVTVAPAPITTATAAPVTTLPEKPNGGTSPSILEVVRPQPVAQPSPAPSLAPTTTAPTSVPTTTAPSPAPSPSSTLVPSPKPIATTSTPSTSATTSPSTPPTLRPAMTSSRAPVAPIQNNNIFNQSGSATIPTPASTSGSSTSPTTNSSSSLRTPSTTAKADSNNDLTDGNEVTPLQGTSATRAVRTMATTMLMGVIGSLSLAVIL